MRSIILRRDGRYDYVDISIINVGYNADCGYNGYSVL